MTAYRILGIASAIATTDQEQHGNQAQVPVTPPSPASPIQSPPSSPAIPVVRRDAVQCFSANILKNCLYRLFADTRILDDYIHNLGDLEDDDDDAMSFINEGDKDERTWSLDSQEGEDFAPYSDDYDGEFYYEDGAAHGGQEQDEDDENTSALQPHGHQLEQDTLLLDSWTFGR